MIGSTTTPSGATQQAWEFEKPIHGGIVVGVDGSRESIAALNTAAAMARVRRCPLHAVSVLPPMSSYQFGTRSEVGTETLNDLRRQLRDSELAGLMKALEPASDWSAEVVIGRPPRELTRVADCAAQISSYLGGDNTGRWIASLARRHHSRLCG
jgi:K+-sensing histidine kinase KdpD